MRHVWSLLTGMMIAPIGWLVLTFGLSLEWKAFEKFETSPLLWAGMFVLMGVGVLLGLVSSLRTSPVGAIVVATIYLGVFFVTMGTYAMHEDAIYRFFETKWELGDLRLDLSGPIISHFPVIGGMLLVAAASAGRWRAWPKNGGQPEGQPNGYAMPSDRLPDGGITPPVQPLTPPSGVHTPLWSEPNQ